MFTRLRVRYASRFSYYWSLKFCIRRWGWTSSLGAPAALVAGAVLVTLGETRQDLAPRRGDKNWIRVTKLLIRFLLLSSFALEVLSIFVSTVTGELFKWMIHRTTEKYQKLKKTYIFLLQERCCWAITPSPLRRKLLVTVALSGFWTTTTNLNSWPFRSGSCKGFFIG